MSCLGLRGLQSMTRILLVGYGRMGKMVESLAGGSGCEVAGVVDPLVSQEGVDSNRWKIVPAIDVAVDFSAPDAVMKNVPALARRGFNVVVGTTGWGPHEPELRRIIGDAGVGIVAAPNFSTAGSSCSKPWSRTQRSSLPLRTISARSCTKRIITPRKTRLRHRAAPQGRHGTGGVPARD